MGFGARPLNFIFVLMCIKCLQCIRSFKSYRLDTIYIYYIYLIMYSQIKFYLFKLLILKPLRSSTEYIIIYFMSDYLIINLY